MTHVLAKASQLKVLSTQFLYMCVNNRGGLAFSSVYFILFWFSFVLSYLIHFFHVPIGMGLDRREDGEDLGGEGRPYSECIL